MAYDFPIQRDKWGMAKWEIADYLAKLAGFKKFGIRLRSDESNLEMPSGVEPFSFDLVDSLAKARICDVDWDDGATAPDGSKGYYKLTLEPEWSDESFREKRKRNPEYIKTSLDAGLEITDEERKILEDSNR